MQNKLLWALSGQNRSLRKAKNELSHQIHHLNIAINSNGFFEVNRRLLISVSSRPRSSFMS